LDRQFVVVAHRPEDVSDPLRGNRMREKRYAFDFALDAGTTQRQLYDLTTKGLVDGVLEGFNATVFAYGATGAGKTYTMIGDSHDPGIMVRASSALFAGLPTSWSM
jgi:kinesin family member 18/19